MRATTSRSDRGAKHVGVYLAAALLGIALSLGPTLHIAGRTVTGDVMPYAWAERALPLLSFMGVPVRFAFAATFNRAPLRATMASTSSAWERF